MDKVEAIWRIESARLIAGLARFVRDVALAEDLAQDALVAALEQWHRDGVPDAPGPWLMAVAKRKAIDALRRRDAYASKLILIQEVPEAEDWDDAIDDHLGDDLLRLIFTAAHPTLTTDAQKALILRMLCGLSTPEIARAFLIPEATAAQRIVRAKKTLTGVRFEMPTKDETTARQSQVLQIVYLIFNEGYAATGGDDWARPALCHEAMRLGRLLASLLPDDAEAHGLLALMELQASRLAARVDAAGEPVPLLEQDRRRWDRALIRHGLDALARAEALGGGPYTLQAMIAACHARAINPAATDWPRIAALYEVLAHVQPGPVVRLNQAVALGFAGDPGRGLRIVDELDLPDYPHHPAVRAELLDRLGRGDEARAELGRAAAMSRNAAEQRLFRRRADRINPAK
ncbi:RNA polymerase sigma factor [Actinoplanes sp. NBRC 103695]|uniref:RNA polymerase sigma factor n=1 Tax=Actinoplanes sp. NBRC 103695 TaxID=3032202 RepID=UPI0024A510F2|nr:RNA polymerase sigma factor [Actinoplanes sp. NBRC 103695]GLY98501.1 RNA polymerase sigma factor [Actinoplanes sp. NBRC 103695]